MSRVHHQHQQAEPLLESARVRLGLSKGVKMIGALAWATGLGVIGVWILIGQSLPGFLGSLDRVERLMVGLGMLSGAQLVFLMFVAERVFVRTPKRLTLSAHWGLMLVGVACFVMFVVGRVWTGVLI
ncbi:MAG: hypothetical protein JJ974_12610 [Phycisphaerales bacterium]|nr:hypothetical protein [Phycisphaerales bacterium]